MTNTISHASANAVSARQLQSVGHQIRRLGLIATYAGLALIYWWFGGMKFTAYEAHGIKALVENSPLLSWTYSIFDVISFSQLLGVMEITVGTLIAARFVTPAASALGGFLSIGLFATTVTFMFTTPGVIEPSLGFPAITVGTGQFLLKDVGLLAGSILVLGDSLIALGRKRGG